MKSKSSQLSSTKLWDTTKSSWTKNIFFIKADCSLSSSRFVDYLKLDNAEYVLRSGSGVEFAYEVELEKLLLPLVAKLIKVPALISDGTLSSQKKHFYQIFLKEKGATLDNYNQNKTRLTILEEFGSYLHKLHEIKAKGFGMLDLHPLASGQIQGVIPYWHDFLQIRLVEHCTILNKAGIINPKEIAAVYKILKSPLPQVSPVLLHGDLANHNIMGEGASFSALLDWEAVIAGPALYDLAYYATGCFDNPDWFNALLKGYFQKAMLPTQDLEHFNILYLRIALAKAVSRLKQSKNSQTLPDLSKRILYALSKFN